MSKNSFTDEEVKKIETMVQMFATRLEIASELGFELDVPTDGSQPFRSSTFEVAVKKNRAVRSALARGASRGRLKVRHALFDEAIVKRQPKLLELLARHELGITAAERLEITGPGGTPLQSLSNEDLEAKYLSVLKKRKDEIK